MSRVILTKCQNQVCNKDFGIDTITFNLYSINEFFEVDCPYCKWRNKKRGIKEE